MQKSRVRLPLTPRQKISAKKRSYFYLISSIKLTMCVDTFMAPTVQH